MERERGKRNDDGGMENSNFCFSTMVLNLEAKQKYILLEVTGMQAFPPPILISHLHFHRRGRRAK